MSASPLLTVAGFLLALAIVGGWVIVHWFVMYRVRRIWQAALVGGVSYGLLLAVLGSAMSVTRISGLPLRESWLFSLAFGVVTVVGAFVWLHGLRWRLRRLLNRPHEGVVGKIERTIAKYNLGHLDEFRDVLFAAKAKRV